MRAVLFTIVTCLAVTLLAQHTVASQARTPPPLPAHLQTLLDSDVRPSRAERRQLLAGQPITKLLPSSTTNEIVVFGGVWINAAPSRYVALVRAVENFEHGGAFRQTRKIGAPPSREDFAGLQLTPEDIADLPHCVPGDCELKLDRAWIEQLKPRTAATGNAAAVNDAFRDLLLRFVTTYLQRGVSSLPVYADKTPSIDSRAEFTGFAARLPLLRQYPAVRRYLTEFPHASLPATEDVLFWQDVKFGLKPIIRVSHIAIHDTGRETIMASNLVYATHYFWTGIEVRIVTPDTRGGFWLFTVSGSRIDGLTGLLGPIVRARVRREAQQGTLTILTTTRGRLERGGN